jgi:hypothetical protein
MKEIKQGFPFKPLLLSLRLWEFQIIILIQG